MSWDEILGHRGVLDRFMRSMENDRLASTYLFVGKRGIGKRTFALKLAEALLCETNGDSLIPCGHCPACQQVRSQTHPDLILIAKPENKNVLPLELFVGSAEKRRQEGLCHDIGLKPFRGGRKIAIIDDADYFNQESANSLLKTLEEPPPKSVLIMIGTSAKRQLPTILSRSQVVRFQSLEPSVIEQILQRLGLTGKLELSDQALAADGSIDQAVLLSQDDFIDFRSDFLRQLGSLDPGRNDFHSQVNTFLEGGGKESAQKKKRFEFVTELAIQFFRAWIHGDHVAHDHEMQTACHNASENAKSILGLDSVESTVHRIAAESISRTLDAQWHANANASFANVLNAWFDDLARLMHGEYLLLGR